MTIIFIVAGGIFALAGWMFWIWQRFLNGFRIELEPNQPMPELHDVPHESWHIPTGNNKLIRGWMLLQPSRPEAPVVVVAHGWTRNATFLWPISYRFWKDGFQVFAMNARNHGECDLDPPMTVLKFTEDMEQVVTAIQTRFPGNKIGLAGHSLGGSAALIASSRFPGIHAAVSICAFSRSEDIFKMDIQKSGIPMNPFGHILLWVISKYLGASFKELAPAEWVKNSRVPALLIGAGKDTRVPPSMQNELKAAFPAGLAKGPVFFPEATHTSLLPEPATYQVIFRFINKELNGFPDPLSVETTSTGL